MSRRPLTTGIYPLHCPSKKQYIHPWPPRALRPGAALLGAPEGDRMGPGEARRGAPGVRPVVGRDDARCVPAGGRAGISRPSVGGLAAGRRGEVGTVLLLGFCTCNSCLRMNR